jgi:NADPH-dependent ferric siderophore reductase
MSLLASIDSQVGSLFLNQGQVLSVRQVSRRVRAIEIHSASLKTCRYLAGQHIRIQVGAFFGSAIFKGEALRTYSIWKFDRANATMTLCVLDHDGAGPGARWAKTVSLGDNVMFSNPSGKLYVRPHTGLHLLIGDETALGPFDAIARAAAGQSVTVLTGTQNDFPSAPEKPVHWIVPQPSPEATLKAVLERVATDAARSNRLGLRTAYVAGEAYTVKAVKRLLLSGLGWSKDDVVAKPFWTPGAKGLE